MGKKFHLLSESDFPKEAVIGLASPKNRLAAFILDIILLLPLLPLIQLIQAPVRRGITETFILGGDPGSWFYRQLDFGIFIALFILYQSLMIYWKGQTVGKMFFRIQVISYNGHLGFFHCFSRSFFTVIEFFLLGYPFLALFSHPLRRPVHDRVADSLVIGLENPTGYPGFGERWKSHFVGNTLLIFIVILGFNYNLKNQGSFPLLSDRGDHCQVIQRQKGSDLETVLQLYLSHQVDRSCLLKVARGSLWKGKNPGLAKFSLAFALGNDAKRSNRYLRDICTGRSTGSLCSFSSWLLELERVDRQSLDKLYSLTDKSDFSDSLRVIAAGFFHARGQFGRVFRVLEPLDSNEVLQPLVAGLLFYSLLGQKEWSEAFWIYRSQASIDFRDVIGFLEMERKNKNLSRMEKLALLDFFFPQLKDYAKTRRWISSSEPLDKDLVEIYGYLLDHP